MVWPITSQPRDAAELQQAVVRHLQAEGTADGDGQVPVRVAGDGQGAEPPQKLGVSLQVVFVVGYGIPAAVAGGGFGVLAPLGIPPLQEVFRFVLFGSVQGANAFAQAAQRERIQEGGAVKENFLGRPVRGRLGGQHEAAGPAAQPLGFTRGQPGFAAGVVVHQAVGVAEDKEPVPLVAIVEPVRRPAPGVVLVPEVLEAALVLVDRDGRLALVEEVRQPP